MLPQLVAPLIQLPLVNPQFLRQLLRADRLHSLHGSSLVFPTPPSISLPLLHSLLRGEFPSCLILGGHSSEGQSLGISPLPLSRFAPSYSVDCMTTTAPKQSRVNSMCMTEELETKEAIYEVYRL